MKNLIILGATTILLSYFLFNSRIASPELVSVEVYSMTSDVPKGMTKKGLAPSFFFSIEEQEQLNTIEKLIYQLKPSDKIFFEGKNRIVCKLFFTNGNHQELVLEGKHLSWEGKTYKIPEELSNILVNRFDVP